MTQTRTQQSDFSNGPDAIILAAGKGSRMGSDLPKVLHTVADRPMVWWVVDACRQAGVARCILVVGYGGELVRQAMADVPGCDFVEQAEQLGTGHATRMAQPLFNGRPVCDVFVLAGDAPLVRPRTLRTMLQTHRQDQASATLATAILADPTGYGRIVRAADGSFDSIVEQKDADQRQLAIQEINPSYYCFRSDLLFQTLSQVGNTNRQGEYYLTDVPGLLKQSGHRVSVVEAVPPQDVLGVNTPAHLDEVDRILRQRLSAKQQGSHHEPR